jgi:hypothetical protein
MFPIVEICIGSGIVSMLWQMNKQIGSLTSEIKRFHDSLEDHENRIRDLEGK